MADQVAGSVEVEVRAALEPFMGDLKRALKAVQDFDRAASQGMRGVGQAADQLSSSVGATSAIMSQLRTVAAGLLGALGIRQIVGYADTWSDLTSRIRFFAGSTEGAQVILGRLFELVDKRVDAVGDPPEVALEQIWGDCVSDDLRARRVET